MRALVYQGHEQVGLEHVPDPTLVEATDAVVRVERTAICGSDLHLYHAPEWPERGFAIGHEFLGTVEAVGRGVQRVRTGERVLVACTTGCGTCASCRRGLFSGCAVTTRGFTALNVFGFGAHLPGGQAEAVRVPFADVNCVRLPAGPSDEQLLLLTDILPTAYMGTELAEVGPGDRVVIFGCGPVGAFAQRCAQVRGAAEVIAVDLDEGRLARARARGCTTVNPRTEDVVARVLALTGGEGADSAIEAVGLPALVEQAAAVVRPGGYIAVIGVILAPFEIPWPTLFAKNVSLRTGLVNPQRYILRLLPLIQAGRLDPAEIVTHRFGLDEGADAYRLFAGHEDGVLKVVLTP